MRTSLWHGTPGLGGAASRSTEESQHGPAALPRAAASFAGNRARRRIFGVLLVLLLALLPALAADKVTDDQIIDQVHLKLASDPDVGSRNIEIEVHGGVVTLKGKVRTEKQREKAEKLVKKVKGVSSVTNQLVVSQD